MSETVSNYASHLQPWWVPEPAPTPEGSQHALCKICRHINFSWLMVNNLPGNDDTEEGKIRLGNLERVIQSTTCPFCRLVVKTIFAVDPGPLPSHDSVFCEIHTIGNIKLTPGHADIWLVDEHGFQATTSSWNCSILLMQEELTDQLYRGRAITGDYVDLSIIKTWLSLCEQSHTQLDTVQQICDNLPKTFRLVDVYKKCLVRAPPACRYVALSYLWGNTTVFRLLSQNLRTLEQPGSLSNPNLHLPQTIKDAIILVESIGEKYIWIDSLCIIQDSDADKNSQIPCMGGIYGSAIFTIVAATGDNANAGLPGVQVTKRKKIQHIEIVQGLPLGNALPDLWTVMNDSIWATRGWTYQERKLSKRLLIFTEYQAYWNCEHTSFHEDKVLETNTLDLDELSWHREERTHRLHFPKKTNFETYVKEVREYTARNISYPSDGLNAFSAITQVLIPRFRGNFWCGIPTTAWDAGLLWYPRGRLKRRVNEASLFPSWSWVAWDGRITYDDDNLCVTTLRRVQWKNLELEDTARSFVSTEEANGCIESEAKSWKRRVDFLDHLTSYIYFTESGDDDTWFSHPILDYPAGTTMPQYKELFIDDNSPFSLRFRALSAKFHITDHHNTASYFNSSACGSSDEEHQVCKLLVFDCYERAVGTVHVSGDMRDNIGGFEFVALSRSTLSNDDDDPSWKNGCFQLPSEDDKMDLSQCFIKSPPYTELSKGSEVVTERVVASNFQHWFDDKIFDSRKPWCLYNVIMIQWVDRRCIPVAERVGIGKIHIDAFHQANPSWKEIVLE